jgi:predicted enzyme related to lactoylglutathione lyase
VNRHESPELSLKEPAMTNKLCFFEIPANDPEKLKQFYADLFQWSFEKGASGFRYYRVHTGEDSLKGGITARQDTEHTSINYVKVDSVDESISKAQTLGASLVVPKKPVAGIGWYAVLKDPENNRLGLWQDDSEAA